jgi:uncharacterized caspase-like protein
LLRFFILTVSVLLTLSNFALAEKRVALVIGNGGYQNFTPLPNPINDAKLMEKVLKDVGFDVTLVLNADQKAMKTAMLEFGRTLRGGVEASLFYYAGHGVQVNGENYLIPIEANLQHEDEVGVQAIDVNDYLQTMESAKSPVNIVVLDACRNNPLNAKRGGSGGLAPVNAPRGSYIAYATAPGGVAADGDGANSPYTAALANVLAMPGLKLEDVFKKTREKVLASTSEAQVPWETSSITGDFYFKIAAPNAATPVLDSAAAEWMLVRNSTSRAVLEAFRDKYVSDPVYRGLAEELLGQIARREQVQHNNEKSPSSPIAVPAAEVASELSKEITVEEQPEKIEPAPTTDAIADPSIKKPVESAAPPKLEVKPSQKKKKPKIATVVSLERTKKSKPIEERSFEPKPIVNKQKTKADTPKIKPPAISMPQKPDPTKYSFTIWAKGKGLIKNRRSTQTPHGRLTCFAFLDGSPRRCIWG